MQPVMPDDLRALQQMLAEKDAALAERERVIAEKEALLTERDRVIAVRDAELYAKTLQIEHLKMQLAMLRRSRYGPSSEKLDREIDQLELILGELEEGVAEHKKQQQLANPPEAQNQPQGQVRTSSGERKSGGRK